jgi:hypothetical protein
MSDPITSTEAGQEVVTPVVEVNEPIQSQTEAPIASTQSEEPLMIPDKFIGKDLKDVISSYTNVESQWKKTQQANKELEDRAKRTEQQLSELQRQQQVERERAAQQPIHSTTPVVSDDELFMKEWEQDPAQATLNRTRRAEQKVAHQERSFKTNEYYKYAKQQLPDFEQLEPEMMKIAEQLAPFARADMIQSPEMVNTCYLMARGSTVDTRMQQAKENGIEEAKQLNREKAAAFSEGSSAPGQMTRFDDLSLEEMRKLLPKVERD